MVEPDEKENCGLILGQYQGLQNRNSGAITQNQGWKPGYLALGFQFRCVETQMAGFSFGLVLPLLKNRFQFQFCLRTTSVSGFQFRFHPRKLFYFE